MRKKAIRALKKVIRFVKRVARKKVARSTERAIPKRRKRPMYDMDKVFESYGGYDGWLSYAETHYIPLLDRVGDALLDSNDKRLMAFLHDDIIKMMNYRG